MFSENLLTLNLIFGTTIHTKSYLRGSTQTITMRQFSATQKEEPI
jgi:hypothetical protein